MTKWKRTVFKLIQAIQNERLNERDINIFVFKDKFTLEATLKIWRSLLLLENNGEMWIKNLFSQ